MDLSHAAGSQYGIRRSYSDASKASASSSAALLPDSSRLKAPNGIPGEFATRTDGSQLHTQRLSSTERSRVLKSTLKLRRILGESLDEEVVRQWVVLPKQIAERKNRGHSSLPSSILDCELEEGSTTSSTSADEDSVEWQRRRASAPLVSQVEEQSSSLQSSIERSITIKRSAKLYSMLGERVDTQSPGPLSSFHLSSDTRSGSGIQTSGVGKGQNATKSSVDTREIDTLQRFVRAGLIEGDSRRPYV
jgi:hypothetical protein